MKNVYLVIGPPGSGKTAVLTKWVRQQAERFGMGKGPNLSEHVIRPLYGNMNVVLLLVVPFITMRLFAEERKLSA